MEPNFYNGCSMHEQKGLLELQAPPTGISCQMYDFTSHSLFQFCTARLHEANLAPTHWPTGIPSVPTKWCICCMPNILNRLFGERLDSLESHDIIQVWCVQHRFRLCGAEQASDIAVI